MVRTTESEADAVIESDSCATEFRLRASVCCMRALLLCVLSCWELFSQDTETPALSYHVHSAETTAPL
jgi:hypothetical protein